MNWNNKEEPGIYVREEKVIQCCRYCGIKRKA
jgi:hypothetical protein